MRKIELNYGQEEREADFEGGTLQDEQSLSNPSF